MTPRGVGEFAVAACVAGLIVAGAALAADATGNAKGFVLTDFSFAIDDGGAAACPEGLAAGIRDIYFAGLTPEQRTDVSRAENLNTLYKVANQAKDGSDRCTTPTAVPEAEAPMRTVQGGPATGLNLDGTADGHATANTCAHQKFPGAGGAAVDNQAYRLLGCVSSFRPGGMYQSMKRASLHSGQWTVLLEVRNPRGWDKDGDVEIGLYSSPNPTPFAASGAPLPNASLSVHKDPHFQTIFHGKLANGVVTTEPADAHIYVMEVEGAEYYLKGARIRAQLLPDGTVKGIVAGYEDNELFYKKHFDMGRLADAAALVGGYDCAASYYGIKRLADGYPDPKTGQCTALSVAFRFEGVPAFVIHPDSDESAAMRTAQAEPEKAGLIGRWLKKFGL